MFNLKQPGAAGHKPDSNFITDPSFVQSKLRTRVNFVPDSNFVTDPNFVPHSNFVPAPKFTLV